MPKNLEGTDLTIYEGGLSIVERDLELVSGIVGIRQNLIQRIQTVRGEWFLDRSVGFPWFEIVFIDQPNLPNIDANLRQIILETRGVLELLDFAFVYDAATRVLEIEIGIDTVDGVINFAGAF